MYSRLVRKEEVSCPICNKTHEVEVRKRMTQALVKGEAVDYEETYYLCTEADEEENEYWPGRTADKNLLMARDAYRASKGLLTSSEIAQIRKYYGITQSEFATILGWGEVTITRYESKAIQDETYDFIMRLFYDNPIFALECLNKHQEKFTAERIKKIRESILSKVLEKGSSYVNEIARKVNEAEQQVC